MSRILVDRTGTEVEIWADVSGLTPGQIAGEAQRWEAILADPQLAADDDNNTLQIVAESGATWPCDVPKHDYKAAANAIWMAWDRQDALAVVAQDFCLHCGREREPEAAWCKWCGRAYDSPVK